MNKNSKKNNGLWIGFERGLVDVKLSLSIGSKKALTYLLMLLVLLLVLALSLDMDIRELLFNALLSVVQWLITRQRDTGKQR